MFYCVESVVLKLIVRCALCLLFNCNLVVSIVVVVGEDQPTIVISDNGKIGSQYTFGVNVVHGQREVRMRAFWLLYIDYVHT